MRLAGKRALITAAANGIGRATVEAFIREGAGVIATDIDPGVMEAWGDFGPGGRALRLDVMDPAAIDDVARQVGPVDVLFNCAGTVQNGALLDCTDREWQFSFDLNVTAMFRMIRAFLPGMIAAGGGAIVNMASVASSLKGVADRCAYGASKAAVIGLTKSIATDYVRHNVRCNAVCPGTVETPSLRARVEALARARGTDLDAALGAFRARQPMGRLGTADEIAEAVVYLASDAAAFVTGSTLVIDGGFIN
ncbi:SDR family oxidoreductase [Gluconacetobacter diazotrophicus]|uniref:SDR family oxidoreductase n=2 Tax=Gluconacetobacter diazotrophicus TaxID=33996 RepID=A0A7W4I7P7_GLUDI|nr:SDR family oxidoreductase [Gluconacetobacter diazotrophicus]MBB2157833.1 SDR family oxidoreductase [Gluconacetobacter diazotrophicus]CAP56610.1 putative oxidoreductase [Gluconacetobacter diazotrophicus PA1 5]